MPITVRFRVKSTIDRADPRCQCGNQASAHQMIVVASRIANWANAARRVKLAAHRQVRVVGFLDPAIV
jgi:hypothetical protein